MARIRTIKPEFWYDEDIASLPAETRLLAIGLLNVADDEGYFKAHPALIRGQIFPFHEDSLNIHGMLTELSGVGYLRLFEGLDGKLYGHVKNFGKHQKVNRPSPSKIKEKDMLTEGSVSAHGGLTHGREGKGKEQAHECASGYAFQGDTIRITEADFSKMQARYPNLDLAYQLSQLDLELRGKKNWFVELNSKLNYRNTQPAHQSKKTSSEVLL